MLIERSGHLLAREAAPLGEALGEVLTRDGIDVILGTGAIARAARRSGLRLGARRRPRLRGDRLLIATGRRPRVDGIGLETWALSPTPADCVDAHLRAGERLWAIGDVTGLWPLTHVGKYQAGSSPRISSAAS